MRSVAGKDAIIAGIQAGTTTAHPARLNCRLYVDPGGVRGRHDENPVQKHAIPQLEGSYCEADNNLATFRILDLSPRRPLPYHQHYFICSDAHSARHRPWPITPLVRLSSGSRWIKLS